MKLLKYLLIATISLTLYSCGPKVLSSVSKKYARTSVDSVRVFNKGEIIPNSSELLGYIKIIDNTLPNKDRYNEVILAGKKKTAKVGGNGLMITDVITTSTMTEASAKMLYLKDFIIDTLAPNPVMENPMAEEPITLYDPKKRVPSNTFSFNVGYGWITSKLYTENGRIDPLGGTEIRIEYNHTFKNGLGVGALYSGFLKNLGNGQNASHLYLNYFGPTITYSFKFNQFIARIGYGLGVTAYDDSVSKFACLGTHGDLKIEYMVTKNIGFNITTTVITSILPSHNYEYDHFDINGIQRVSLTGGLCVYF